MKLDLQEVKSLCYKAKRGLQTKAELRRFMKLSEKFAGNKDFEKARIYGQALAMSEVNPAYDVEYWVSQLSVPVVIEWEEVSYPDWDAVEHLLAPDGRRGGSKKSKLVVPAAGKA